MNKLRIGVVVYYESKPIEGGGHSYYETLLEGINAYNFNRDIEVVNIVFTDNNTAIKLQKPCIYIKEKQFYDKEFKTKVKKITSFINLGYYFSKRNPIISFLIAEKQEARNRRIEEILKENRIDLVYYLKPEYEIFNYPFIATHWDVAHKSMFAFPETALDNNYRLREDYYLYTLNRAFLIFCESQAGASELKRFYPYFDAKIKVVPIFSSNILKETISLEEQHQILEKYQLTKGKYFVYPAQFWSCKNHYNLILAFDKLIKTIPEEQIKLLLPGSDNGNMGYIKQVIESLDLQNHVFIPGFVSTKELFAFYKNAIALTMPTFLGPTNIPLIEAAQLKCAVVCSDFEGHREILADNARYFDPSDYNAIFQAMLEMLDEKTRNALVELAYVHITNSPFNINKSLKKINSILEDCHLIRKTWGIEY